MPGWPPGLLFESLFLEPNRFNSVLSLWRGCWEGVVKAVADAAVRRRVVKVASFVMVSSFVLWGSKINRRVSCHVEPQSSRKGDT